MTSISKTLRVGAGESSTREVASAASKPKAKKGYIDQFCHNDPRPFARCGDQWIPTTIYRGIRYLARKIDPPENYPLIKKIRKNRATTKALAFDDTEKLDNDSKGVFIGETPKTLHVVCGTFRRHYR